MADDAGNKANDKPQEAEYVEEEEVLEGDWQRPQVDVKEVEVKSGEEEEEQFWSHRAKLYRWAKDGGEKDGEWKERGLGDAKLLKHKGTKKIRFLLRQEKTLKIVANHYVVCHGKLCTLTPNAGNEKIWVWTVTDFAEGEPRMEQFALKFGQPADALEFKLKFEEACKLNTPLFEDHLKGHEEGTVPEENKDDTKSEDA